MLYHFNDKIEDLVIFLFSFPHSPLFRCFFCSLLYLLQPLLAGRVAYGVEVSETTILAEPRVRTVAGVLLVEICTMETPPLGAQSLGSTRFRSTDR
jgi:hypothetical protein